MILQYNNMKHLVLSGKRIDEVQFFLFFLLTSQKKLRQTEPEL